MRTAVVRHLALLMLAALCPGFAFAVSETYEGQLIPMNNEPPIPIIIQIDDVAGFLSGKISTSYPFRYTSTIEAGRNVAGRCNLAAVLSSNITLRLFGDCGRTVFEGKYAIYYKEPKKIRRGTFRVTRQIVDAGKGAGLTAGGSSASLIVACTKANGRCLAACPRGDTNVEYLCANHCRTKMQACKGKASKMESDPE